MITVTGLGDEIVTVMIKNKQKKIVEGILLAASNGLTSSSFDAKGITPSFISSLEHEGISAVELENGKFKFFWEF